VSAYFDSGFSVRKPVWHNQATILDDYPTDWDDARKKAGLEWEPELCDVYGYEPLDGVQAIVDEQMTLITAKSIATHAVREWIEREYGDDSMIVPEPMGVMVRQRNVKRVRRSDTHGTLGHVTEKFSLVLHKTMGEILETILGLTNVKFETAGSCKGGAQVWALAYLDEPTRVAGDDTETFPFIVLLNNHDGSGACKLVMTSVRVVCWNTYNAASMEGERTGRQFTFSHVGDVNARIEEAVKALAGVRDEANEWHTLADELFGMRCDDAAFLTFTQDFIPEPVGEIISDRVRANVDRARGVFKHLYMDSVTCAAHKGTALGLVDASVEYLDHVRGYRNRDTLLGRTLLRPEPLKAKAVLLAREHCNN